MSQWTHVHGIIRVDSMLGIISPGSPKDALKGCFENAPKGSEGPVGVHFTETRTHNSMSWGFVALEGDLRDFGEVDVPTIEAWLRKALDGFKAKQCFARDFVVGVSVEYGPTIIYYGNAESFEVKEFAPAKVPE